MNKLSSRLVSWLTVCSLSIGVAQAAEYQLDPEHTSVIVAWDHFGFSHPSAVIPINQGTLNFDPQDLKTANVEVILAMDKVQSQVPALDKKFASREYFDSQHYPTAKFRSTKVTATGDHRYDIQGELTLKEVTQPITLHAQLNRRGEHPMSKKQAVGFDATTTFNRSAFGLGQFTPAVADQVTLRITTEAAVAN